MSFPWNEIGRAYLRGVLALAIALLGVIGYAVTASSTAAWSKNMPPVVWLILVAVGLTIPAVQGYGRAIVERDSVRKQLTAELAALQMKLGEQNLGFANGATRKHRELMYGPLSPMTPAQRMEAAKDEFDRLSDAASAGDRSAVRPVLDFADVYLALLRDWTGGAGNYRSESERVREVLTRIHGTYQSGTGPAEIERVLERAVG